MTNLRPIVVGYDGSDDALHALRWAATQAARERAVLVVVHAYDFPYLERLGADTQRQLHDEALAVADDGARIAGDTEPGIEVHAVVEVGEPATVLVAHAADAQLLVVGHRGAARAHHLLGSVASRCVHRSPCSVMVVRTPETDR